MPRRTFNKKTATTFSLVYRSQNDALIHDENAPSMVFTEKQTPHRPQQDDDSAPSTSASVVSDTLSYRSSRARPRSELDAEFGSTTRQNEGEAAQHGVFYDDTQYDYMKHMRDLGAGQGPVTWVDASAPPEKKKGKQRLEDALRAMDFGGAADDQSMGGSSMASSARSLLPEEVLPSEFVQKRTYQDQQDVPDAIAGFQPDMDPRLREVLEALEDEEYVDEDEDVFGQLTGDGAEVDREEWERLGEQQVFDEGEAELDEGWESDDTIRAGSPSRTSSKTLPFTLPNTQDAAPPEDPHAAPTADPTGGAWQEVYAQLKADSKATNPETKAARAAPSALDASILSSLASGRRKKRKGAKTSTTNYSMTSSALLRTEQQTLLDSRLDAILEKEDSLYDDDSASELNDSASLASGMTGMSKASRASRYSNISGLSGVSGMSGMSSYSRASDAEAPMLERADFDGIMDDFLGKYNKAGKAGLRVRRGKPMTGMEQLDEVRAGLGPARLKKSVAKTG